MTDVLTKGRAEVEHKIYTTKDGAYDDWFCVKTEPFPCPCGEFVANFMTCAHFIIIWPSMDDPSLLQMCGVAHKHGRNPKVVEYEDDFGPCVSYYTIKSDPKIVPHVGR